KNNGEYDALDVGVVPKLAQGWELLTNATYSWDIIEAGEQVTFSVPYRPVESEQWPIIQLFYEDIEGNGYVDHLEFGAVNVIERQVDAPFIIIDTQAVKREAGKGQVDITVHNYGNTQTTVNI